VCLGIFGILPMRVLVRASVCVCVCALEPVPMPVFECAYVCVRARV
jgi:hypothetical protein